LPADRVEALIKDGFGTGTARTDAIQAIKIAYKLFGDQCVAPFVGVAYYDKNHDLARQIGVLGANDQLKYDPAYFEPILGLLSRYPTDPRYMNAPRIELVRWLILYASSDASNDDLQEIVAKVDMDDYSSRLLAFASYQLGGDQNAKMLRYLSAKIKSSPPCIDIRWRQRLWFLWAMRD
jgi:hypothetical protein